MIVCNEIAERLWQAGVEWLPPELPTVDLIIHAVPLPDALWQLQRHPPASLAPRIFVPFGDHTHEDMPDATWDTLVALSKAHRHRRVLAVCSQGKNRSGLISALILIARGHGAEDAIAQVQERGSDPGTVRALSNPRFQAKLRRHFL